jgi:hypothetical protein
MNNITVLSNFPENLNQQLITIYNYLNANEEPLKISDMHYYIRVPSILCNELKSDFNINFDGLEIYYIKPLNKRMIPHIDRGRKTALQVPIDIDTSLSYTFSFKGIDLNELTPADNQFSWDNQSAVVNNLDHFFFQWDEDQFDQYDLSMPIIQNAAMPHGGANFSQRDRIFFSFSFVDDYSDIVNRFRHWV